MRQRHLGEVEQFLDSIGGNLVLLGIKTKDIKDGVNETAQDRTLVKWCETSEDVLELRRGEGVGQELSVAGQAKPYDRICIQSEFDCISEGEVTDRFDTCHCLPLRRSLRVEQDLSCRCVEVFVQEYVH